MRKNHESSKKRPKLSNNHTRSSVSQDFACSLSTVKNGTTDVKNLKQIKIISSYSCAGSAPGMNLANSALKWLNN